MKEQNKNKNKSMYQNRSEKQKNNKKTVILLVLSLLALAVILGVVYFLIGIDRTDRNESTTQPPTSGNSTVLTSTPSDTAESLIPTGSDTTPTNTTQTLVPTDSNTTPPPTDSITVVSYSKQFSEELTMGEYKIGRVSYYLPEIKYDQNQELADSIAKAVEESIKETVADYKAQCEFFSLDYDPEDPSYYIYTTNFQSYLSPGYISFKISSETDYGYENGTDVYCLCYSLEDGKLMSKENLGISLPVLAEEAIDKTLSMSCDFSENYKEKIRKIICNSWYLEDDKIVLIFNPYEIASGLSGIIEIPVSLKNL